MNLVDGVLGGYTVGAFIASSMAITGYLAETVGYKAGLALNREEIGEHLGDTPDVRDAVLVQEDRQIRLRSEELEAALTGLLYRVGNIPTPQPLPPITAVYRRFADDPARNGILEEVLTRCVETIRVEIANTPHGTPLGFQQTLETAAAEFGESGHEIAVALVEGILLQLHTSPWVPQRWFDWNDPIQLRDLFERENLETQYGTFFDQRFVDYLAQNFQKIGKINWRQFERLTAEHFQQAGFRVDLGPGRKDGGVDVRVWDPTNDPAKPLLLLIQCKRVVDDVAQVIVKALWADVVHEEAKSGLIVTTSKLSPSADEVRTVRAYPIDVAERATLRKWIEQMRSPGIGTFLA